METKIRAIVTGATGMVGEGVLHECLLHPDVETVLVIGRKACGVVHTKLKEVIIPDFFDLTSIEERLAGYNACFFCLGVSSLGMKEPEYTRITYDLTMNAAKTLYRINPEMTFCYVSGSGTDGSEKGKLMWARVKGKTENDLSKLGFKAEYNFRPAFMLPTKGLKNVLSFYKYVTWLYPVVHPLFPGSFGTLSDVGLAMINCALYGTGKKVLNSKDIAELAARKG
jgi:uncharacterized protein YbjT (DUF2867 family)